MSKKRGLFGAAPNYDTPLTPEQERAYRQWAGKRATDTQDYDMRGAYLANALASANGHFPDTYKKPNHPTFSEESQYSTADNPGGRWVPDGRGNWVFWASPANLQYRGMNALAGYFNQVEPNSAVVMPSNYRLPRK